MATQNRCKKHGHWRPCKLCVTFRAKCGGKTSSAKKARANKAKAYRAIMHRWHPDKY